MNTKEAADFVISEKVLTLTNLLVSKCHAPRCRSLSCPQSCKCNAKKKLGLHTAAIWTLAKLTKRISYQRHEQEQKRLLALAFNLVENLKHLVFLHYDKYPNTYGILYHAEEALKNILTESYFDRAIRKIKRIPRLSK